MNAAHPLGPVFVHRYVLRSGGALNSASVRREFHGALIKVDEGHGCIHPWPEFGDADVERQLELLAQGMPTPLTQMALRCAQIDGDARRCDVSLFEGLTIPRSHYSWSFAQDEKAQTDLVLGENWPAIKAKGTADWGCALRFLDRLSGAFETGGAKLRIDFNGCLGIDAFERFCELMPARVKQALDLVEDPISYDAEAWRDLRSRFGVRLALDKGWQSATEGFDAVVIKPSRRDWRGVAARFPDMPVVLTSAMDHAFGQMFAAYEAAQANAAMPARLSHCGLATQHLFERDDFFAQVSSPSGFLKLESWGTGLGFDETLAQLPWTRLI